MAYDRPPLISRESPRNQRRRRRAQQQSTCCCSLVVAACLVIMVVAWRGSILSVFSHRSHGGRSTATTSAGFPLQLAADAPVYLRYNLVRLTIDVLDAQGQKRMVTTPPEITVTRDGEIVTTIGDFKEITPRYGRSAQRYTACWPIPWNATVGTYIAEARIAMTDPQAWTWETQRRRKRRRHEEPPAAPTGTAFCIARARFAVTGYPPNPNIPKGTCVATWEPDFADRLRKPDGSWGDWHAMLDWCEFVGADTFWFRGGVTELNTNNKLTDQEPFNTANIEAIPELAQEAHHRGLRFGAWAAAYATYGDARYNPKKPKYAWAKDISRGSGVVRDLDFISLLDRKRITHLASYFAQIQNDPNVDYVGLDYMRSDRGGYEMVDKFTSEMPLRLPADWDSWSRTRKMAYVAMKREKEWQTDPRFYDAWNWWRAHTGAENVRDMIAQSQLKKPLWIFVLSWWHGMQHGQDPIMFTDAGTSILAPMLYQVDSRAMFDSMVKDWHAYLGEGQANICPGDQVDFHWHQSMISPRAAPEELYDRIVTAHRQYQNTGVTLGAFWHDINRACVPGNDGPYPGTEWGLAGGSAFSTVRMDWGVYPLKAQLVLPKSAPLNTTVEGQLTLQNTTKKSVNRIKVELAKTEGVEQAGALEAVSLRGEHTDSQPVRVRLKSGHGDRGNRMMVCVRIRWPDDDYGKDIRRDLPRMILAMQYVQGK